VSCKEGGGGKNVFCSKKINFDFTVFLYANLPFFLKTNGGKWREHFPAETSHLFYPNRKHYNQKPSKNLNLSKCLHATSKQATARQNKARQESTRQDGARQGNTQQDTTRQDNPPPPPPHQNPPIPSNSNPNPKP
jgi:hypothetical protein